MQKGFDDFKHLIVTTFTIPNFTLAIPIKSRIAQVIAEDLLHRHIGNFGLPKLLIVDKD